MHGYQSVRERAKRKREPPARSPRQPRMEPSLSDKITHARMDVSIYYH